MIDWRYIGRQLLIKRVLPALALIALAIALAMCFGGRS
jgi:hypothetical protein